ncbi:unnamed protein product (mitochondrion) [Plasmodiophora brassicae]|uniref:Uncharacterized protein n=1 Tax=Plasmodiophora brassicae TaxID=37360 RepID=A0A0G4IV08_PLABS|nr:hypothetical protein PBRA_007206 [Plasmodiophora brassicae]SPQ98645.1 unnamed protein product [Plasmodiophora brassicae]
MMKDLLVVVSCVLIALAAAANPPGGQPDVPPQPVQTSADGQQALEANPLVRAAIFATENPVLAAGLMGGLVGLAQRRRQVADGTVETFWGGSKPVYRKVGAGPLTRMVTGGALGAGAAAAAPYIRKKFNDLDAVKSHAPKVTAFAGKAASATKAAVAYARNARDYVAGLSGEAGRSGEVSGDQA